MRNSEEDRFNWRPYLGRNERLLWQGDGKSAPRFSGRMIPQLISLLMMLAFAIFWTSQAAQGGLIFALFGFGFIAIAGYQLYRLLSRHLKLGGHVHYALTDKRALRVFRGELTSQPITPSTRLRVEHNNGHDDIHLDYFRDLPLTTEDDQRYGWNLDFRSAQKQSVFVFEGIDDGEALYQRILDLQSTPPPS